MTIDHSLRLSVYGLPVDIHNEADLLKDEVRRFASPFFGSDPDSATSITTGILRPYDPSEVLRHLSPTATAIGEMDQLIELYQEGERFWVVDDRWGLSEINLLKNQWRSWLLPHARVDAVQCLDMAVLWPLAQLLRHRGLGVIPAASLVKDGWGLLILSPFGIEPELSALVSSGYRVIGQRWTTLREEDGRIALLHVPGRVEHFVPPHRRMNASESSIHWADLTANRPELAAIHGFCDTILAIDPGRRPEAHLKTIPSDHTCELLRDTWPIVELHSHRRGTGKLQSILSQQCRCCRVQLSRNSRNFVEIVESLRATHLAQHHPRFQNRS